MKCHHAHEEITLILTQVANPSAQLQQHIQDCELCREHWQQQALEPWLAEMHVVPAPVVAKLAQSLWVDFRSSHG